MNGGYYQAQDIRRVNDDKREQAGKRQGSHYLEEATNQEWTEARHAKNKQTVSNIQEYLAMTIAAHTRFGTTKYTAAKAVASLTMGHLEPKSHLH